MAAWNEHLTKYKRKLEEKIFRYLLKHMRKTSPRTIVIGKGTTSSGSCSAGEKWGST
jgi:hypothetical protein